MKLYILIATYNGEKYIEDLINSIVSQKGIESFHILIRDDNSNDNTLGIIERIASNHENIEIIRDSLGNLNAKGNFNQLAKAAIERDADYVMFADQDDIWKEDKIEKTFKCMCDGENKFEKYTPLLVHTDLCVVDDSLKVIHTSFMKYQRIHHMEHDPIKTLLVQNFVTGCTVMANRALLNIAHPVPDDAVIHDWWYALCAATYGNILHIPEATLLYRQHEYNEIGAKEYWHTLKIRMLHRYRYIINKLFNKNSNLELTNMTDFIDTIKQAEYLSRYSDLHDNVPPATKKLIQEYCRIFQKDISALHKIITYQRLGIRRQDIIRDVILKFRVFIY